MEFEWDPTKIEDNEGKHGISFEDAVVVFDDPYRREEDSSKLEHGETRRKVVGRMGAVIVAVVYTDRDRRRRIISARIARRNERAGYDQGTSES
jgi:uncharacterized DUF497 family protein